MNYDDAITRYDWETKTGANPVTLTSPGWRPDPRYDGG